tara:strand:- start:25 stop:876 length:852 start_codon:yes stop_codon:yes gene_type:complete
MKIVGLGKAGCSLAQAFSKFPQYETVKIDVEKSADITIKRRATHEEYDAKFPSLKRKLKFTNEDVMLIVCGAGNVSGGVLRLLEQLQNNNVTVLYIQPDLRLLSEIQKKQDKIVSNVLQEYARSGAIDAIWLVDNRRVEFGIGEVPIMGYYEVLNQAIVNMIHMINVFKNSEPVIGNFIAPSELSRIATIGLLEIDEEVESWFYGLTNVRDVVYYYGINEAELKDDTTLFKKITNYVASKLEETKNVSYGVYKTTYEQRYCYCIQYSSMVQSYKDLLDDQDIG